MQTLVLVCAILCTIVRADNGFPNTIDMINSIDMDHIWMEIGYTQLNIHTWTTVTSTVVNFNADGLSPILAYFSLPEYGNSSFATSFPMVPKMNGRPTQNGDGSFSFEGILVMPDDAYCSNEWWIPEDPGVFEMPWLMAEVGVYNLSNNMIIVQEGNITRENSNQIFQDTPHLSHHTVVFNFTSGCNASDLEQPCTYPEHPDDGTYDQVATYAPWMEIGSLQQLQTSLRKANNTHLQGQVTDVGNTLPDVKELYLSVRGRRIFTDRAQYMVMTHAVGDRDNNPFPDYETIDTAELLAFLIYEKSVRIRCTEGLVIETDIFYDVTSLALQFDYQSTFAFPPGLFAMLGSMSSVGDSTVLRSFNRTINSASFITQEDQCYDEEQEHTTKEYAFAFVVGQEAADTDTNDGVVTINCWAVFKNNQPTGVPTGEPSSMPSSEPSSDPTSNPSSSPTTNPTSSPTSVPTSSPTSMPTLTPTTMPTDSAGNCTFTFLLFDLFGDGYYTTFVNMTTTKHRDENSTSQFHQPNCTAKVVSVYSETCSIDVSMLTMDGSNPLLTWESYWILNHEGETYIGDFFSKLSVEYGVVTFTEKMVDYSVPGKANNKCHECPHPPPYNANSPPGVCENTATAKECPPGIKDGFPIPKPGKGGPGKGGPGEGGPGKEGPGAGGPGKGGPGEGGPGKEGPGAGAGGPGADDDKKRMLSKDDDHSDHNHTRSDDDHSSHNHTRSDDDHSSHNHTRSDDDHSSHNHTDDDNSRNSTGSDDDHIHYSYGKPKPKPKPPYLVYINMFDELSNGFLDKSGDWSDYFHTQDLVGTGGDYADLKAPILVPNVMAYPKYYIMTKDRQKLIKPPKSICDQKRGAEYCQEALPWNGHFIFRFAGIEPSDPADAATWEFCGMSGGINEEFEFIIREGVCYPLTNKLTALTYCQYGFETAITMNGVFSIQGNFNSLSELSEVDTSLLEKELALLMPGQLTVTIQSVTHEVADTFNVYFKASIIAESVGYDGSQVDKVDTMMYELEATLAEAFSNGMMKSRLVNDLDALPNTQDDVLRQSSTIQLLGYMEIDSLTYQEKQTGVTSHSGDSGSSWSVPELITIVTSPGQKKELSETAGIISLAGVVVGALVTMFVATTVIKQRNGEAVDFSLPSFGFSSEGHTQLPGDSEHAVTLDTQIQEDVSVSAHPLSDLRRSKRPTIDLSLSSVEAGHKAVHYADDIDAALFSHSKQQYEQNVANRRSFI